jgi:hypothetical protein
MGAVVLAEARQTRNAADGPVLCAQAVGHAARTVTGDHDPDSISGLGVGQPARRPKGRAVLAGLRSWDGPKKVPRHYSPAWRVKRATAEYAVLDYRMHHGTLPFGGADVVLGEAWPMFLVLLVILLWLFPDGRLPPGRWRGVARVLVAAGVLVGLAASARGVAAVAGHDIRIDAGGNLAADQNGPWSIPITVVIAGSLAGGLTWLIVQVPRYRRSAGERRQQLKWLYTGAVVFVISVFLPGQVGNDLIGPLGAAALPVCIGVAVLKYRLFEIDRIISRVISYAIITAVLAGVFAGLVVLAAEVLPFKAPVAVAAATLVVAALFNPLRRRVQHAVDRRFNRARYDAEAIVAAFTARLRQTVDLDTVRSDLVGVVHQAFQPAHVSVWLPPDER